MLFPRKGHFIVSFLFNPGRRYNKNTNIYFVIICLTLHEALGGFRSQSCLYQKHCKQSNINIRMWLEWYMPVESETASVSIFSFFQTETRLTVWADAPNLCHTIDVIMLSVCVPR